MSLGRDSRFNKSYIWWVSAFLIILILSFKFPVGQQFNLIFAPLLHAVQAPVRWYQDFSLWWSDADELQTQYKLLERKTNQQQALHQQLEVLKIENQQLRKFLNITAIEGYTWRVAEVISRGPETKSRRLMIALQQTQADDVVVSFEGLVGLVDVNNKKYATVRTILDASVTVPVTMKHSDLSGLVRGDGERLTVDFIPLEKAPQEGDVLITSGAGGLFPAGIPVAQVKQVRAIQGGVFAEVVAVPIAVWQRDAWLAVASKVRDKP